MNNKTIHGYTSFLKAAEWKNQLIMCNNILEIDPDLLFTDDRFIDEAMSEEDFLADKEEAEYYENDYDRYLDSFEEQRFQVYQWFLTDLTEMEAKYKHEVFGLEYYYSEKLEMYVMPVYHFGTSWRILSCPIYDEEFIRFNKDMLVENQHGYCNL